MTLPEREAPNEVIPSDFVPSEPRADPDLSVMRDYRLVAQIWKCNGGTLRRAGRRGAEPICEVPYADILTFDATQDGVLATLVSESPDEEAFLFKLEIEGFRIVEGVVAPHLTTRRF